MNICTNCHTQTPKWSGQCLSCHEWNTLEAMEEVGRKVGTSRKKWASKNAKQQEVLSLKKLSSSTVDKKRFTSKKIPIKSGELSSVFWWGILPGSFTLLSGEPGIGKSTLTLQLASWIASEENPVLYVSWEEWIGQIADRAERMHLDTSGVECVHSQNLEDILVTLWTSKASVIVIDSVSVLYSQELWSALGSIAQIRHIAEQLMVFAKSSWKAIILIGHVTKDGDLAGPKTLEHLVDTVLFLEWSRHESYRMLRARKNRFWATDEVWLFRMTDEWLIDVDNPGMEFLSWDSHVWSALWVTMEWSRPILLEFEALNSSTKFWYPKRSVRWFPSQKLDLLLAVLSKFWWVNMDSDDVYLNVGRWFRVDEPGCDLAIMASIVSTKKWINLWKTVFLWEVGLTWVIRPASQSLKRIQELKKLWFTDIVTSSKVESMWKNLSWLRYVQDVKEFIGLMT